MNNTVYRIKEYIDYKGISIRKFEEQMGFSNGSFASQYKNNRTIGVDKVENILQKHSEINPTWLLTGEGPMLKGEVANDLPVASRSESSSGIPLIPSAAMAGAMAGALNILEYECEHYSIPMFKGAEFMISVKGSSMYPTYSSGDVVACKRVDMSGLFFQWNKVYVIDTDQGPLIKRIKKGSTPDTILLVSDNTKYDPFELPLTSIYSVALVIGLVRLE